MNIRKSTMDDLDAILSIYERARAFMAEKGNPHQWGGGYPEKERVIKDIELGHSYVCTSQDNIAAVFYFAQEEDASYSKIIEGDWKNQEPYGVVHRIASAEGGKGSASFCLLWCMEQTGNLRMDTHEDNIPMQRLLQKHGFVRCGIIFVEDGSRRLAYQWSR